MAHKTPDMMKICVIMAMVMTFSSASLAETSNFTPANKSSSGEVAGEPLRQSKAGEKAERGVRNMLFGWTDVPRSIIQVTQESDNPFWGITAGTFKGLGKALPRTVSGVADTITFPLEIERCYEAPYKQPHAPRTSEPIKERQ